MRAKIQSDGKTEPIAVSPTYSEAMTRLEAIVERVERGDVDVDELAASVKEAAGLVRLCRDRLRGAKTQVEEALKGLEQAGGALADGEAAASRDGRDGTRVVERASALEIDFE